MCKKAGIIGFGNIGKKLHEKLNQMGWNIVFFTDKRLIWTDISSPAQDEIVNWQKYCQNIDVVFLAIPTLDDGHSAVDYITRLRGKNISVVTCEKGALANYFTELRPLLPGIGYSATVGGGSGIIHFLKQRFFSGTQEIHAILNGTMNYIFSDLMMGNPLGHIVEEAKKLGYAEPGESDPIKIILAEAVFDATKKASILFNLCFNSDTVLRASDIKVTLTEEMVRNAIREANNRRFVVSFLRQNGFKPEASDISAFCHAVGDWIIKGGFTRLDNPLITRLCNATSWVNNGLLSVEGKDGADGVYLCVGPGAGASATTAAMIRDAESFI